MYRIIKRLIQIFYKYYNQNIFKKVDCNLNKIRIGSDIFSGFTIKFPENLSIGDGTSINGQCYINAKGKVQIGKYCHIGKGLTIFSHNHNFKSNKNIPYDSSILEREVVIGDATWIGANVSIAPGTRIGNGVIISIGSIVFGDIPDCAIIRGNPATIIGYRDINTFNDLYNQKAYF